MRTFHLYNEIYRTNLFVVLGGTRAELFQLLKKRFGIEIPEYWSSLAEGSTHLNLKNDPPYRVVHISGEVAEHEIVPALVHETFHLVTEIIDDHMLPNSSENSEPGAYLQEWYVAKILEKFEKLKQK